MTAADWLKQQSNSCTEVSQTFERAAQNCGIGSPKTCMQIMNSVHTRLHICLVFRSFSYTAISHDKLLYISVKCQLCLIAGLQEYSDPVHMQQLLHAMCTCNSFLYEIFMIQLAQIKPQQHHCGVCSNLLS